MTCTCIIIQHIDFIMKLFSAMVDFYLIYDEASWCENMNPDKKSLILRWLLRPMGLVFYGCRMEGVFYLYTSPYV